MPNDPGIIATIEHVTSHHAFRERVFIEPQLTSAPHRVHPWQGWFASWEPLREGDELRITLDDGRKGRALVNRVQLDFDLVDPIISFTGTSPLE